MNSAAEKLAKLREELTALRSSGQEAVSIDGIDSRLADLQAVVLSQATESGQPSQNYFDYKLEFSKQRRESFRKDNENVINLAVSAIKALTLINGGAAVAMLAFVGNVISKADGYVNAFQSASLIAFTFATAMGVLVSALAFFAARNYANMRMCDDQTQDFNETPPAFRDTKDSVLRDVALKRERFRRRGVMFYRFAVAFFIASIGLTIVGAICAHKGLTAYPSQKIFPVSMGTYKPKAHPPQNPPAVTAPRAPA